MTKEKYRTAVNDVILLRGCAVNNMTATKEQMAGITDKNFEQERAKSVRKVTAMDIDKALLFQKMEESKIWYMPLKGSVINLSEEQEQLRLFMANLSVREYTAIQKYKFYLEVKELLERMKESGQYRGGMQKGIADILNVTKRQVTKYSAIEKLPFNIQQELEGTISINKAVEMTAFRGY